jgi:hypothetical protein
MDWHVIAVWIAVLIAITAINAYRYVVRSPVMYLVGTAMFGAGALLAATNHRGPVANLWAAVAFAGWLASGIGYFGIPPRRPSRRIHRAR